MPNQYSAQCVPNCKCKRCGKLFHRKPSHILKKGAGAWCSRACQYPLLTPKDFWERVDIKNPTECWNWKGPTGNRDYGIFSLGHTKSCGAHRIAYELSKGKIPKECDVLHKCDNPPCVNPDHLFLGTQAVNNADCAAKLRKPSKLTADQVRCIRVKWAAGGFSKADLAREYGVSHRTIRYIVGNEFWRHLL